jgi:hypothetical protein
MAETAELQNHVKKLEGLFVGLGYIKPDQANGAVDADFLAAQQKFVDDFKRISLSTAKTAETKAAYEGITEYDSTAGSVIGKGIGNLKADYLKYPALQYYANGQGFLTKTYQQLDAQVKPIFGDLASRMKTVLEFAENSESYIASMNAVYAHRLTLLQKPAADKPAADQPTASSNPVIPPSDAPAKVDSPKPMTVEEASVTAENGIAVMAELVEMMAKESKQTNLTLARPGVADANFDDTSQQALQGVISGLRLGGIIKDGVNNFFTPEMGEALKTRLDALAKSDKPEEKSIPTIVDGALKSKGIKGGVDEFLLSLNTLHANKKLADKDLDTGAKIQMLGMQMSVQDIEMIKGVVSAITQFFPGAMTFLNGLAKQFFNKDLNELIPGLMPETAVASAAPLEKPAEPEEKPAELASTTPDKPAEEKPAEPVVANTQPSAATSAPSAPAATSSEASTQTADSAQPTEPAQTTPATAAKPTISLSGIFSAAGMPLLGLVARQFEPGTLKIGFNAEANKGPVQPEAPAQAVAALTDEERAERTALRLQELTDNSDSLTSETAVAAVDAGRRELDRTPGQSMRFGGGGLAA